MFKTNNHHKSDSVRMTRDAVVSKTFGSTKRNHSRVHSALKIANARQVFVANRYTHWLTESVHILAPFSEDYKFEIQKSNFKNSRHFILYDTLFLHSFKKKLCVIIKWILNLKCGRKNYIF